MNVFDEEESPDESTERDQILSTLKPEINSFVFTRLAGSVPLWEANQISEKIYDLIAETWQRVVTEVETVPPGMRIAVNDQPLSPGHGGHGSGRFG